MDESNGETWRFTAKTATADCVYLVLDGTTTPSRWIRMQPDAHVLGDWTAIAEVAPGLSRVRYFTAENGAYINCGSIGLTGQRLSKPSPAVKIEDFSFAASA